MTVAEAFELAEELIDLGANVTIQVTQPLVADRPTPLDAETAERMQGSQAAASDEPTVLLSVSSSAGADLPPDLLGKLTERDVQIATSDLVVR